MDIQEDICVIPFQMQCLFPSLQFPSFNKGSSLRDVGGGGVVSGPAYSWYTLLLLQTKGIMDLCLLKKPFSVLSVMFPSLSHYTNALLTSACFMRPTEHFGHSGLREKGRFLCNLRKLVSLCVARCQNDSSHLWSLVGQNHKSQDPAAMLKVFDRDWFKESC